MIGSPDIHPGFANPIPNGSHDALQSIVLRADGRALARGLRVAGKVEPLFVADIAQMPSTIVDNARPGDVVLTMGAGSIGAVPAKVVQLLAKDKLETHIGRGL